MDREVGQHLDKTCGNPNLRGHYQGRVDPVEPPHALIPRPLSAGGKVKLQLLQRRLIWRA
jgi:hypothetical protein